MENSTKEIIQRESAITQRAAQYVLALLTRRHNPNLVFHNYSLINRQVQLVHELAIAEKTDKQTLEISVLAAWFLHSGFFVDYQRPLASSIRELGTFFSKQKYPEANKQRVVNCLQTVGHDRLAEEPEARLLSDAVSAAAYLEDYPERMDLLRLEWELLGIRQLDDIAWGLREKEQLLRLRLYTSSGKARFQPLIGRHLIELKEKERKRVKKIVAPLEQTPFKQLEKSPTSRGTQTFFRTNYRNHINLSAIADNKANIMISVNSILISVLITFLSYRNIAETNPMILLPVTLFLVAGLASLIFAVLSARPKVTKHLTEEGQPDLSQRNIIFFGSFARMELPDYEEAMDMVLKNDELLYGNMVRDLYFLGKVLDKKYRYLTLSYNIFMLGFIITVGSFLFILFS